MNRDSRDICPETFSPEYREAILRQVFRATGWLHGSDSTTSSRLLPFDEVISRFRSRGFIPSCLTDLCSQVGQFDNPADSLAHAVSFAACTFPRRSQRLDETLGLRLKAFCETCTSNRPISGILQERMPVNMDADKVDRLLSDLVAADCVGNPDSEAGEQEKEERRTGGMLYLITCYPDLIGRICSVWHLEADAVACMRRKGSTPPSLLTHEDRLSIGARGNRGWPQWSRVGKRLDELLPDTAGETNGRMIILEQMFWNKMRTYGMSCDAIWQRVQEFWDHMWKKLTSGFPYFSFRSRFVWWWKNCLGTGSIPRSKMVPLDDRFGTDFSPYGGTLEEVGGAETFTPDDLWICHEGYRIVRASFFPLTSTDDSSESDIKEDPARRNESHRRILDEIWYLRLEKQLAKEATAELIAEMKKDFPRLNENTIYTLSRRLQLRIWAYTLARLTGLTNHCIRNIERPKAARRDGAGERPLKGEKGIFRITSLARTVPRDRTLLWALIADLLLHDLVDPQHPDPWEFKRIIQEIWWWVTDPMFRAALDNGAGIPTVPDADVRQALDGGPLENLLKGLEGCRDQEDLHVYTATELNSDTEDAVRGLLSRILGVEDLKDLLEPTSNVLKKHKRTVERHWFVPVWYLGIVEGLREEDMLNRLCVDNQERDSVEALAKETVLLRERPSRHEFGSL